MSVSDNYNTPDPDPDPKVSCDLRRNLLPAAEALLVGESVV